MLYGVCVCVCVCVCVWCVICVLNPFVMDDIVSGLRLLSNSFFRSPKQKLTNSHNVSLTLRYKLNNSVHEKNKYWGAFV